MGHSFSARDAWRAGQHLAKTAKKAYHTGRNIYHSAGRAYSGQTQGPFGSKLKRKVQKKAHGVSTAKENRKGAIHGEYEKSYTKLTIYKHPKIKLEPGIIKFKTDLNGILTWNLNTQGISLNNYMMTYSQLIVNTSAYTNAQGPWALMDLVPNQTTTSTSVPSGAVTAKPLNDSIFVKHILYHLTISNLSNVEAEGEIYVLKAKKPLNLGSIEDPYTLWNQGYIDSALSTAAAAQRALAVTSTVGYANATMVYTKPSDSSIFKHYWQIMHVEPFNLTTGQGTLKKTFAFNMNKKVSRDFLAEVFRDNTTQACIPGSLCVMVVARGASVEKDSVSATAGLGSGEIGWISETEYILKVPMENIQVPKFALVKQNNYSTAIQANLSHVGDMDTLVTNVKV